MTQEREDTMHVQSSELGVGGRGEAKACHEVPVGGHVRATVLVGVQESVLTSVGEAVAN